jgi:hypothetical protein
VQFAVKFMHCIMRLLFILTLVTSTAFGQLSLFNLDNADSTEFARFLANKEVVVVGEMHGTTEILGFVLKLIRQLSQKGKTISVGLEIPTNYQNDMENFLKTGDFDKLLTLDYFKYADGRTSVAMGELIKALRKIDKLNVICFDVDSELNLTNNRDSLMGVNLSRNYEGGQIIILTGNLHANLKEGCWQPDFKSAIFYFNKMSGLGDKLISLNTYYTGGTIWNCMQDDCKERVAGSHGGNLKQTYGLSNFVGIYDHVHSSGYNGFVYFDRVTASRPIVD